MSQEIDESVKKIIRCAKDNAYGPVNLQGAPSYSMSPLQQREQTRWVSSLVFKQRPPQIFICQQDYYFCTPQAVGTGISYFDYMGRSHDPKDGHNLTPVTWQELSEYGCHRMRELFRSMASVSQRWNTPIKVGPNYIVPETGLKAKEVVAKTCRLTKLSTCKKFGMIPEESECEKCEEEEGRTTESSAWSGKIVEQRMSVSGKIVERKDEDQEELKRRQKMFERLKAKVVGPC
jgi:hypothetical protein